jgi:hypothetical protein
LRALFPAAFLAALSCGPVRDSTPAEARAVRYLAREVPLWPVKNKCFSCHNNGDAARALLAARRLSIPFDDAALQSTIEWLRRPEGWEDNGPKVEYSDKKLATLEFAHALLLVTEKEDPSLIRAAERVAALQEKDGSWAVDADGLPGSPVTYGRTLATVVALRIFASADPKRFADPIDRAQRWLLNKKPDGVFDVAALLLGGRRNPEECLEILRKGQTRDGGWGPYVTSPPEVFDTAVALLALMAQIDQPGVPEMVRRGREYLVQTQESDGSWPETTRPPGAESYAQRISTTGWALLALLSIPRD